MIAVVSFVVTLVVFYFVVRMAVRDGILDADDVRLARTQARRLKEKLRNVSVRDSTDS